MSWIDEIEPEDAQGRLAETFAGMKRSRGKVSNIMKVQGQDVRAMEAHMELYMALMFTRSGLKREEMEMLATVVSVKNRCDYCINHHGEALNNYWKDEARLKEFIDDYRTASISERQMAMLEYGSKLTESPGMMMEEDVAALRSAGFSDAEILRINMIASYFNFVNRIAVGLGVEFTQEEMRGYKI